MDEHKLNLIDKQLSLILSIKNNRSDKWALRLWSRYIKARDQYKCVVCSSKEKIQAHHIFRRSLYPHGWFQPGNGITLCFTCHNRQHATFNGSPNLNMPVDMEGGDNLDDASYYIYSLIKDAHLQKLAHNEFYYIDDHMLVFFMKLQSCMHMTKFLNDEKYSKLELAHEIWRTAPSKMIRALIKANIPQWAIL
ncbi:HNH endonuclease [Pseudomonas sp. UW4]|uniref:HNH endonuclease n=1 Tax=Pseudomonas sp. UW4 TaxID=1207075 RepID=UPI00029CE767|nr:HNH endonuclease [Pseudomonas sp. UW4]AFY21379.1 hypothetical protein PputUW4_04187 [Pseudomonas sp. UW4]